MVQQYPLIEREPRSRYHSLCPIGIKFKTWLSRSPKVWETLTPNLRPFIGKMINRVTLPNQWYPIYSSKTRKTTCRPLHLMMALGCSNLERCLITCNEQQRLMHFEWFWTSFISWMLPATWTMNWESSVLAVVNMFLSPNVGAIPLATGVEM